MFQQDHYLANFVQSTFNALPSEKVKGVALIPLYRLCLVTQSFSFNLAFWTSSPSQVFLTDRDGAHALLYQQLYGSCLVNFSVNYPVSGSD